MLFTFSLVVNKCEFDEEIIVFYRRMFLHLVALRDKDTTDVRGGVTRSMRRLPLPGKIQSLGIWQRKIAAPPPREAQHLMLKIKPISRGTEPLAASAHLRREVSS